MADRPKLSVKPLAPGRDPYRARVRAATAPRPAPQPREAAREADPGEAPRGPAGPARERPRRPDRPAFNDQGPGPRGPQRPPRPQAAPGPKAPPPPVEPRPAPRKNSGREEPHADGLRVAKLMTDRGLSSRREADEWIEAGWVRVNGRLAILGQRAAADALIEIDPKAATEQAQRVTVLLHKPIGYVSGQAEDGYEPASVLVTRANHWNGDESGIDLHAGHLRHLAPAGRLDIDSTGLLVLTQDGRVAKRLIGDETRVEKEYLVRVSHKGEGPFPEAAMERLRHGLELDGVQLRPARVSWQNEDQLRFVLREGRKRQIRRMCEQVGLSVLGLKRVRIGSVSLGPLPVGQWRFLREDERF